jgi:hypothetical protein
VVVAVLSSFSATHEMGTPAAIPIFLSYFVLLILIWTAQVHYDVRYETEDLIYRIAKVLQIGLLIFMGAAGGGWNPSKLQDALPMLKHDVDLSLEDATAHCE